MHGGGKVMPLAHKGSRPITVDGTKYRWVVSSDNSYVVVVIKAYESAGQRTEVYINTDINRLWVEFPHINDLNLRIVKPSDVRAMINKLLRRGGNRMRNGGRWCSMLPMRRPNCLSDRITSG